MGSEPVPPERSAVKAEYNELMAKVGDAFEAPDPKAAHRGIAKSLGDWAEKINANSAAYDVNDQPFFQEIAARAKCQQGLQLLEAGDTAQGVFATLKGMLETFQH
jgi:hypothetical protein